MENRCGDLLTLQIKQNLWKSIFLIQKWSYHILSYHNMMLESVIDDSFSSYSNVNASRNIDPVWLNLWDWG